MSLESWSLGIVRPVMEVYPQAWAFFVAFILPSTYAALNLFIGVIVSAMQEDYEASASADRQTLHDDTAAVLEEVRALRGEVASLRPRMTSPRSVEDTRAYLAAGRASRKRRDALSRTRISSRF